MKEIVLVAGLPRAGSTLLCAILAQNPRFQFAGTSGLLDLLLLIRNGWDRIDEFKAMPLEESEATKYRDLRAILANHHPKKHWNLTPPDTGVTYPQSCTVFDRSRGWLAHLEMIEELLGRPVKVLVPVRDVREVLASLEMLWRKHKALELFPAEAFDPDAFESAWGRCNFWMGDKGWVGRAYTRLRDAQLRGLGSRLQLVRYEALTAWPEDVLRDVYDFLDEDYFEGHHFEDIAVPWSEDDRAYGVPGLHAVRPRLSPRDSIWPNVLGKVAEPYGVLNEALGYPAES